MYSTDKQRTFRVFRSPNFVFAAIGAAIAMTCVSLQAKATKQDQPAAPVIKKVNNIVYYNPDKFTTEKFKEYLVELNIKFPHIVFAQAVLETGNFKSKVFRNNHNLFGMKEAKQRATTNAGTELGHAIYKNWRESVVDYALYQCAFLSKLKTEEEYYNYLHEHYAEDPAYVKLVQKIASEFKTSLKS